MEKEKISEGIANILRSAVRPILTIYLTVLWGSMYWSIVEQGGSIGDIDSAFTAFVWGLDAWWFGDRTFFKGKGILGAVKDGLVRGIKGVDSATG